MTALQLIKKMWLIPYLTRWDTAKNAAIVAAELKGDEELKQAIINMPKHYKVSFLPNTTIGVKYWIDNVEVQQKNNLVEAGRKIEMKVTKPGYTSNIRNVTINANGIYSFTLVQDTAPPPVNNAPVVHLGVDKEVMEGEPFTLVATASDLDNDALTYLWVPPAGCDCTELTKPELTVDHVMLPGSYTFIISVSDGKATSSDSINVLVKAKPVIQTYTLTVNIVGDTTDGDVYIDGLFLPGRIFEFPKDAHLHPSVQWPGFVFTSTDNLHITLTQNTTVTFTAVKVTATVKRWSDVTAWASGKLPDANTNVVVDGHLIADVNATVAGITVNGTLEFENVHVKTTKNVVVNGLLKAHTGHLQFIGIDETKMIGGGMTVLDSDVGLWVMGNGKLDLQGNVKTRFSTLTQSVLNGSISAPVKDVKGWAVGDEIGFCSTDKPHLSPQDYTTEPLDWWAKERYERRIIKNIAGNLVTFDRPLLADYKTVDTGDFIVYPHIANLTANTKISGTKTGRSHIFIHSPQQQVIKGIELQYMGPRKVQAGHNRPQQISGRYAIHFHHCFDGSRGSVVSDNVIKDCGNRMMVPHNSHGITFERNVTWDCLEHHIWWDILEQSHDTIIKNNLLVVARYNGVNKSSAGTLLGMGDDNSYLDNIHYYVHSGDNDASGGLEWTANNEGVWHYKGNIFIGMVTAQWVWQNTTNNHTVNDSIVINCHLAGRWGAYSEAYQHNKGYNYRSLTSWKASSANDYGIVCTDITWNAGGEDYCMWGEDSPIPGSVNNSNKFIRCKFKNFGKAAIKIWSQSEAFRSIKVFDFIDCDFSGGKPYAFVIENGIQPMNGFMVRVQNGNKAIQAVWMDGKVVETAIPPFAPTVWGNGNGLTAKYYAGSKFEKLAVERIDPYLYFMSWSVNPFISPNGVHHKVQGDLYSVEWTGFIEAQVTETQLIGAGSAGGVRIWIDTVLVLDSWKETMNTDWVWSKPLSLVAGQKYAIKVQHFNDSAYRGFLLGWKHSFGHVIIPTTQLYSS